MSLWMLQRYVTAEVDIFSDVSNLIESARQNMSERISDGEELTYNTVGINKHLDGRGQCFLHSRRILHGITDCPIVQWQKTSESIDYFANTVSWSGDSTTSNAQRTENRCYINQQYKQTQRRLY